MANPSLIILYVEAPELSARFYADLLGREPVGHAPTFFAFNLDGGYTLGLWATRTVAPPPSPSGNRSELAFLVQDAAAVDELHGQWVRKGIRIAQEPFTAVFGRTFVGLDPDGHRLRVCIADA
jgi:catechol 2,3-dioxygenase-like lactoylglutathione lyase family enzyme